MNSGDEFTREAALKAADMGFNITTHCTGDRCNALMLDIYEEIRAAGHTDNILSTTHSWWVRPQDVPRWAKDNVIVQTSGIWLFYRPQYIPSLGQERNDTEQFPMRAWADSGAVIALGADYPATSLAGVMETFIRLLFRWGYRRDEGLSGTCSRTNRNANGKPNATARGSSNASRCSLP